MIHEALYQLSSFRQWWKRNLRAGHAYAEGNARHGKLPERFWEKEVQSNRKWGTAALFPLAWPLHAALALKVAHSMHHGRGLPTGTALQYGLATAVGKLPQMLGQRTYYADQRAGRRAAIIEYKGPAVS